MDKKNQTELAEKGRAALDAMLAVTDYWQERDAELHQVGGDCYRRAQLILSKYRWVKYEIITSKTTSTLIGTYERMRPSGFFGEDIPTDPEEEVEYDMPDEYTIAEIYTALDLSDQNFYTKNALSQWMSSNLMPLEVILCSLTETIISRIEECGERGARQAKLLKAVYIDKDTKTMTMPEIYKYLNMSSSSYSRNHQDAVTTFSRFLFSPSADLYLDPDDNRYERHNTFLNVLVQAGEYLQESQEV